MGKAALNTQHEQVSSYYMGYLRNAVRTIETVIRQIQSADASPKHLRKAIDTAHRIKGNAAMYDLPELGLKAAQVEDKLRSLTKKFRQERASSTLSDFTDNILNFCGELETEDQASLKLNTTDSFNSQNITTADIELNPERKTILIAFRDHWSCETLEPLLKDEYNILIAHTGQTTLDITECANPDLIILDDQFEDQTGLDVIRSVKNLKAEGAPSFYVAFSDNEPEKMAETISHGISGFMTGQFDFLDIVRFVRDEFRTVKPKILVVDDDPMVRQRLSLILSQDGFEVQTRNDGVEALEFLENQIPDIILLDRYMPRLEGGTVLYEIRKRPDFAEIPVLILTAMSHQGEAQSWFRRGASDFIAKPFDPEEVLMRVRHHLELERAIA